MFAPDNAITFRGHASCGTVKSFIEKLEAKGFLLIYNGDEPGTPPELDFTPNSLHYVLQSPVPLHELNLDEEVYDLAPVGDHVYMCEWHYHFVKLISPE